MARSATISTALLALIAPLLLLPAPAAVAAEGTVDFARDVQPILAEHCVSCHGAERVRGHLRLDAKALAMEGGTSGTSIVPGDGAKSLLVQRMRGELDEPRMPLKRPALPEAQIALISRWIDQGAHWPDDAAGEAVARRQHWSFAKPARPTPPEVTDKAWPRNAIDRFILARLEKDGITPSPEAERHTLLRRAALDLTGLPPAPSALDQFIGDSSDAAYERQVERLLASPHFGERQARHWLDHARYADSNGYSMDLPRSIWPYRDWVIKALNADLPFDRFATEQLAGDLLPDATDDQRIATGFHRNTQINTEGGIDPEQFRVEAVMDRVATTSTVFLGMTVACAQCHNHKFDPISQREYYELFAFFNNDDEPTMKVASPIDPAELKALKARVKALQEAVDAKVSAWEATLMPEQTGKLKPAAREALAVPIEMRDAKQKAAVVEALKAVDNDFGATTDEVAALKQQVASPTTLVLAPREGEPRKTHLFTKGDFTRPADEVKPGVPRVLHPLKAENANPNRLDLARWITSEDNPLTARVVVNRIWQQYFGRGLVETENDFGTQGTPPTHPELLDWLATELVASGWSQKHVHRLIVTSATYRQSSVARPDLANVDPYNKLLARQSRLRLDAEIVRDVALASSGLLNPKLGGPSVFPPIPDGVMALGQIKHEWRTSTGPDRFRRGLYTFTFRNTLHPSLATFDAPDAIAACTRRLRSNTPLQALNLLNDTAWVEFARGLAARAIGERPASESTDDRDRVAHVLRLATSRAPADDEVDVLTALLATVRADFKGDTANAAALAGKEIPDGTSTEEFAAWTLVARAALNLDETITRE